MIEPKDRVTKTTEENCHNTLEERLLEQDEISFKAGQKDRLLDVIDWIHLWQRGMEEMPEWQAKLKDWGIK